MPDYCCVPGCKTTGTGHRFPEDKHRRKQWVHAIRRSQSKQNKTPWEPSARSVVCRNHFTAGDYTSTLLGERRRLNLDAVPKLYIQDPQEISQRKLRAQKRTHLQHKEMPIEEPVVMNEVTVGVEMEVESEPQECVTEGSNTALPAETSFSSIGTQSNRKQRMFSIHEFINQPSTVQYYTSFENYEHFIFFFNILGPASSQLGLKQVSIPPEDQLFLTLMKLRQAKDDFELGIFFNIGEATVSTIFTTWVNFLHYQLSEIDVWPSRIAIDSYMPSNFGKMFPSTRVILDGTEIPIQKPRSSGPQRETFSSYKNKNTLKVVVGCTPRGAVSYVSDAFGGSASDRQILERSSLCTDRSLFDNGDSIMADRGIMVQDLFANQNVNVNTPTMLRGKSQLEPEEVHRDRKVASKRIHIERVIGLAKTYKLLKKDMNSNMLTLGNRVIRVCFLLCNFRRSIVKKSA